MIKRLGFNIAQAGRRRLIHCRHRYKKLRNERPSEDLVIHDYREQGLTVDWKRAKELYERRHDMYGLELVLDLHNCNVDKFNRSDIDQYFTKLCKLINMEKCDSYVWDDVDVPEEERQTSPQTKGTSAVQFILTSSVVIHTLDLLKNVYVNIFSCKTFDTKKAADFTVKFFEGKVVQCVVLDRK